MGRKLAGPGHVGPQLDRHRRARRHLRAHRAGAAAGRRRRVRLQRCRRQRRDRLRRRGDRRERHSARGVGVRGASGRQDGVRGESFGGSELQFGAAGVRGRSDSGIGVRGESLSNSSVVGVTNGAGYGAFGLHFSTDPGSGVFGESVLGNGVEGHSFSAFGVRGEGRTGGVHGISDSTDPNAGAILGENPRGFAGLFLGRVRVTGFLSKAGGGFEIDHPLDPANKYLRHRSSSVLRC